MLADKKKLHFFRLCVIFGTIVLLTLMAEWSMPGATKDSTSMMNSSMGSMMSSMHLNDISLSDLFNQAERQETASGTSSHHSGEETALGSLHYFTTISIVFLLPFIIGGSIFLAIVWLR